MFEGARAYIFGICFTGALVDLGVQPLLLSGSFLPLARTGFPREPHILVALN